MARVNINVLGISKLKWVEWVNLIQMTIISLLWARIPRINGVAIIVNKRV